MLAVAVSAGGGGGDTTAAARLGSGSGGGGGGDGGSRPSCDQVSRSRCVTDVLGRRASLVTCNAELDLRGGDSLSTRQHTQPYSSAASGAGSQQITTIDKYKRI